jgi:hypothetical protein
MLVPALIPFVVSKIVLPLVYLVLELFVEDPYNINIIPENYKGDIIRSVIWILGYLPIYVLSIRSVQHFHLGQFFTQVLCYMSRSVTVPQRIPFRTSPFRAMRTLFTPTELSRPTAFLPLVRGVGMCLLLRRFYAVFIYADIHMWIASWVSLATGIPTDPAEFIPEGYADFMPTKEMAISFGMLVTTSVLVHIGTAVLICPLEVIAMRLTAQRVYEASCGADKNGDKEADKDVLFDVEDQRNVQKETDETPEPESSESSRPEMASPVAFRYERFIAAWPCTNRSNQTGRGVQAPLMTVSCPASN